MTAGAVGAYGAFPPVENAWCIWALSISCEQCAKSTNSAKLVRQTVEIGISPYNVMPCRRVARKDGEQRRQSSAAQTTRVYPAGDADWLHHLMEPTNSGTEVPSSCCVTGAFEWREDLDVSRERTRDLFCIVFFFFWPLQCGEVQHLVGIIMNPYPGDCTREITTFGILFRAPLNA